jgi:crossover junction endodeoxyribonuclease RusA
MADYEFNLPWPPTVNHYHQPIRRGSGVRIIKGGKAREYAKEAGKVIDALGLSGEAISGDVAIAITLHPPTLASYDVDGRPKGILDALTEAGFWLDDSQVQKMTVEKGEKVKGGMVRVRVDLCQ